MMRSSPCIFEKVFSQVKKASYCSRKRTHSRVLLSAKRRWERSWRIILLWVGSGFGLYEWLENLGTVPLQLRSHISSLKLYDLYKPLRQMRTHATKNPKQPHRAMDVCFSNLKPNTYCCDWKGGFTSSQTTCLPQSLIQVFSPSVCVSLSRTDFNVHRRKEKETWGKRRGKP